MKNFGLPSLEKVRFSGKICSNFHRRTLFPATLTILSLFLVLLYIAGCGGAGEDSWNGSGSLNPSIEGDERFGLGSGRSPLIDRETIQRARADGSKFISQIGPFERQKWQGQEKIETCNLVMYLQTDEGWVDVSPGMVPKNAGRVNNDIIYVSSIADGEAPAKDTIMRDVPEDWVMFQGLHLPGGGEYYANLYADSVQDGNTLTHFAYTLEDPMGWNHGHVWVKKSVEIENPGTTTLDFFWESPQSTTNWSIEYKSWFELDEQEN
jgi:hypothetical protein